MALGVNYGRMNMDASSREVVFPDRFSLHGFQSCQICTRHMRPQHEDNGNEHKGCCISSQLLPIHHLPVECPAAGGCLCTIRWCLPCKVGISMADGRVDAQMFLSPLHWVLSHCELLDCFCTTCTLHCENAQPWALQLLEEEEVHAKTGGRLRNDHCWWTVCLSGILFVFHAYRLSGNDFYPALLWSRDRYRPTFVSFPQNWSLQNCV